MEIRIIEVLLYFMHAYKFSIHVYRVIIIILSLMSLYTCIYCCMNKHCIYVINYFKEEPVR